MIPRVADQGQSPHQAGHRQTSPCAQDLAHNLPAGEKSGSDILHFAYLYRS